MSTNLLTFLKVVFWTIFAAMLVVVFILGLTEGEGGRFAATVIAVVVGYPLVLLRDWTSAQEQKLKAEQEGDQGVS